MPEALPEQYKMQFVNMLNNTWRLVIFEWKADGRRRQGGVWEICDIIEFIGEAKKAKAFFQKTIAARMFPPELR